ncbi:hypothetical protein ACFL04_00395 [Patescibacteria group bacterium]
MSNETGQDKPIAKVTHYFNKINVAVVQVTEDEIKVGDTLVFRGHGNEFTQQINSLQVEHQNVDTIKAGESAGLKVDEPVKEGDLIYRAE